MSLTATFISFEIILAVIWLFLFIRSRETRIEMITIGTLAVLFTPMFLFLNLQAFPSSTGSSAAALTILDFLFSFTFSGIAAVIFQSIFKKHYSSLKKGKKAKKNAVSDKWFIHMFIVVTIWAWITLLLIFLLQLTPFQAVVVASLLVGSYMISARQDLLWNAIWSGLLMALVLFVLYEISFFRYAKTLQDSALSGTGGSEQFISSVPVEALIWAASMGFVLGPLYEYVRNIRLTSK